MNATDSPLSSYCRAPRLPFRKLDDQVVVVNPAGRQVHVLNPMGSHIWELLAEARTIPQILASLEQEGAFLTEERAQVEADVATFVAELAANGLISTQPPRAGGG